MAALLEKIRFRVDEQLDFVHIRFGSINARIGYRLGFVLDQNLRLAAKQAARFDRAPASFWRDVDLDDLEDCPRPSRWPQQSQLTPTVRNYYVGVNPPLVSLCFDDMAQEMDYETAIRLGHAIRRASRRAKAWAGDHSSHSRMMGLITDAEQDYKLGLA